MPILAGRKVTADEFNRLRTGLYFAQATSSLTRVDATYADVPGASVTFTTTGANAEYAVYAVFDCAVGTAAATNRMLGRIVTDGVAEGGFAIHEMDQTDRDTVATLARGTLAAAGSHTIKLQGALSSAAGSGTFQAFTQVLVIVSEQP
ncbi:hypothetical protein LUW75_10920 [Streptomyces sp. MRC013]|uniref:hypothetical protein n=1 Tax=Streptomyces sp. MRC013 TaxID=2898276 RepID=UPI002025B96B|nr:hypothetical protein [Streptomyces sp. MRC013]URM90425.1 hypothetical protein LUW75_10920 [Streptomyces sp. MRC013]